MTNISSRLLQAKRASNLSSADIAAAVGVSERTVSAWLQGSMPNRVNMEKLAKVLGVNEEWLETGAIDGVKVATPQAMSVAVEYDKLTAERRAIIDALLTEWKK